MTNSNMNLDTMEERRSSVFQADQKLERTDEEVTGPETAAATPSDKTWDRLCEKDWGELSSFEKSEAEQDVLGRNVLAATAPRTLSDLGIEALDRELMQRQQVRQKNPTPDALLLSSLANSGMFQDGDFRLMFARADRLDPRKAASRIVAYFSLALSLFGQEALIRPVRPSDFSPADEETLKKGWIQLLLTRDKIGRRIVVLDDLGTDDVPIRNKIRVALFILQVAAADLDSQKKGVQLIIQVFNPDKSRLLMDPSVRGQFSRMFACSPVRFSCIHFCLPAISSRPEDVARKMGSSSAPPAERLSITESAASLLGRDERVRTRFHTGSIIECHEKLAEYGINPDSVPMTSTGRVKLRDHEKWFMIQAGRERSHQQGRIFPIVECPTNKHILLVKGRHVARHEGNMRLRSILQERYDERNEASRAEKIAITAQVMDRLLEEGYEFLVKNSGDFWVVPDGRTVLEKLAIAFRTVPRLKPLNT